MSEDVSMGPGELLISKTAVFDFARFYKEVREWFSERDYDFQEKSNENKDKDFGKEIDIKWEATRDVDSYVKFFISINFYIRGMQKVEVQFGEERLLLDQGKVDIYIKMKLVLDYKNSWDKNNFTKFLGGIYNNYLIKRKVDNHYIPVLYGEVQELMERIKGLLLMYQF